MLPADVRILDTKMVARLVHKALAMHAIDMNEFAVVVLGQNYAHTKNLLCHPQPYPRLPENVQADYWTMAKWLQKTLSGIWSFQTLLPCLLKYYEIIKILCIFQKG